MVERPAIDLPPGAFLLMRHGETEANAADIICGQTDLPLSPRGHLQADQAAAFLAHLPLTRILTSPLLRARQSAAPLAARLDLVAQTVAGFAERDWGAWEGQPRAILKREATPPEGESPKAFRARVRAALARIDRAEPLLIVAHSGTAREIHAALAPATPHRRLTNAEAVLWVPGAHGWHCHECFKPAG
ncbi:histidine phosphatase family protein [Rhodobacter maris]|uniref:Probable phosphoglycerate mutase n=1 Tax=Rhodobacter maris TaxID=446682 RepID=A0A285SN31_9RHOB|nr:histidine phosphatase family protein [Rhodobacter maris]SOC09461.1 probable phosphoglycerate mutase [Rhodobacter maris]